MKSRNLRVIKGEKPLLYWGKKQAKSVLDEDGKVHLVIIDEGLQRVYVPAQFADAYHPIAVKDIIHEYELN